MRLRGFQGELKRYSLIGLYCDRSNVSHASHYRRISRALIDFRIKGDYKSANPRMHFVT